MTAPGTAPFTLPPPFAEAQTDKAARLFARLTALTAQHYAQCADYARMLDALHPNWRAAVSLEELPWLPVGVFKHLRLTSVADDAIVRELRSSGTTGSSPSRIFLDRDTAQRQTRALAAIVTDFIGRERRPMLILDQEDLLGQSATLGARAAAVLGFSTFGRAHTYALRADLSLHHERVARFIAECADRPALLFGFTSVVWQHCVQQLAAQGLQLRLPAGSVLIHGGGWKKLAAQAIDDTAFKAAVRATLGIDQVHDYYGMAEQVGSIFMACPQGRLHAPSYADVIVRDPLTLAPLPLGQTGILQMISELPTSYPGHSVLTEDLGYLLGADDCPCGRQGHSLRVLGRLPRAELRGCSDTRP